MMLRIAAASLLVAAALSVSRISAQGEEMSGSGEDPDGSCRLPETSTMPTMIEFNALNEIRCHLACIDKVYYVVL
jgi:hypothetical protein